MSNDLFYQIALTMIPFIGDVHARELMQHFGDAEKVFSAKKSTLNRIPGIGTIRSENIKSFNDFKRVEKEIDFIERYKIQVLQFTETNYPKRLSHCYDAPVLLYYKGNADLNSSKILSVIGTRNPTDYGKEMVENLIRDLAKHGVVICSGLAYGIDTHAHKAALKNSLSTVGVLAHGLDRIYPPANKSLAKEMTEQGGLLTDFISGTKPDKQNFPKRNRIVAGMSDATLVIETQMNGGSMITAELANSYNREVFALPGKITDTKSTGCNYLIGNNKAALITGADDILNMMNWQNTPAKKRVIQRELFVDLTEEERLILSIITEKEAVSIDEMIPLSQLNSGAIAAAILSLELEGLITTLPGKIYRLS